jgi:protein CWC15
VKKRDLRAELLAAEQEAKNKKRKAEGKPPLLEDTPVQPADDESNKRRKLLQEALELDKDDDESADEKGKGKDDEDEDER